MSNSTTFRNLRITEAEETALVEIIRYFNDMGLPENVNFEDYDSLSDTSRDEDFYKQSKRIKHGRDLDSLKITIIITNTVRVFAEVVYNFKEMK